MAKWRWDKDKAEREREGMEALLAQLEGRPELENYTLTIRRSSGRRGESLRISHNDFPAIGATVRFRYNSFACQYGNVAGVTFETGEMGDRVSRRYGYDFDAMKLGEAQIAKGLAAVTARIEERLAYFKRAMELSAAGKEEAAKVAAQLDARGFVAEVIDYHGTPAVDVATGEGSGSHLCRIDVGAHGATELRWKAGEASLNDAARARLCDVVEGIETLRDLMYPPPE